MMYEEWTIEDVPGTWNDQALLIDIETRKLPTPDGYRMPNGEPLRNRWGVYLLGYAWCGVVSLMMGEEPDVLASISYMIREALSVVYGATREFDEMVLRGRMTNA